MTYFLYSERVRLWKHVRINCVCMCLGLNICAYSTEKCTDPHTVAGMRVSGLGGIFLQFRASEQYEYMCQ